MYRLFIGSAALAWVGVLGTPASANVLSNGGFDDFGPQASGTAPIDDWAGISAKYNGTTHIAFGGPGFAFGGDNYGTVDAFLFGVIPSGFSVVATQTVAVAPGFVKLTGAIAGGTTLSFNDPNATAHFVRIEDGGSLAKTFTLPDNVSGGTDWIPFTLAGETDGSGITVTWGYTFTQEVDFSGEPFGPDAGILTTHVDELDLTIIPEPSTVALFIAGACALVRRRRAARA